MTNGFGKTEPRGGFSLIELLAAITILLIMVGIMGKIFTESNKTWVFGTDQAMNSLSGRAALDIMATDLENAIAYSYNYELTNGVVSSKNPLTQAFAIFPDTIDVWGAPKPSYEMNNTDMCFVTLVSHDDKQSVVHHASRDDGYTINPLRDTRRIIYTVGFDDRYLDLPIKFSNAEQYRRYCLIRREGSGEMTYSNEGAKNHDELWWWSGRRGEGNPWEERMKRIVTSGGWVYTNDIPVADNVIGFRAFAPDIHGVVTNYYFSHFNTNYLNDIHQAIDPSGPYPTDNQDRIPEYVDLCLDVLNEREMVRANQMSAPGSAFTEEEVRDFIEKKMKRYTRRVYLHNRHGYRPRGLKGP